MITAVQVRSTTKSRQALLFAGFHLGWTLKNPVSKVRSRQTFMSVSSKNPHGQGVFDTSYNDATAYIRPPRVHVVSIAPSMGCNSPAGTNLSFSKRDSTVGDDLHSWNTENDMNHLIGLAEYGML